MKMIFALSEDVVKVANTNDIRPSHMKEAEVNGENICVVNVEGKYYAIGSICTHEGCPLADGTLECYEVECRWHNSKFDIRTGEVTSPPGMIKAMQSLLQDDLEILKERIKVEEFRLLMMFNLQLIGSSTVVILSLRILISSLCQE